MLDHRRVNPPCINFADTHLYTWVERDAARIKCFVQERNTMSPARAQIRTARYGGERTHHEAAAPPTPSHWSYIGKEKGKKKRDMSVQIYFHAAHYTFHYSTTLFMLLFCNFTTSGVLKQLRLKSTLSHFIRV